MIVSNLDQSQIKNKSENCPTYRCIVTKSIKAGLILIPPSSERKFSITLPNFEFVFLNLNKP